MEIWMYESHGLMEAEDLCASKTLPFVRTSTQILFLSTSFKKGDTIGTTKTEQFLGPRRRLSPVCDGETLWSAGYQICPIRKCPFSIHHKPVATSSKA